MSAYALMKILGSAPSRYDRGILKVTWGIIKGRGTTSEVDGTNHFLQCEREC